MEDINNIDNNIEMYQMDNSEIELYEAELRCLRSSLQENSSEIGDWKIVKCMEANLLGEEMPYDVNELNAERQKVRDRINELELLILEKQKEIPIS